MSIPTSETEIRKLLVIADYVSVNDDDRSTATEARGIAAALRWVLGEADEVDGILGDISFIEEPQVMQPVESPAA